MRAMEEIGAAIAFMAVFALLAPSSATSTLRRTTTGDATEGRRSVV